MTKPAKGPTVYERKQRTKMTKGQKAEALMSNPLLSEAFDSVEKKIEEGWKGTPDAPSTPETRERAYLMHRLLQQLKREFEVIIREGKSAAKLLEIEEQARGRSSKPEPSTD